MGCKYNIRGNLSNTECSEKAANKSLSGDLSLVLEEFSIKVLNKPDSDSGLRTLDSEL